MKRFLVLMAACTLLFLFNGCNTTVTGDAGLIEKAREVIPLSDIENTDIQIAGTGALTDSLLVWFVTGNAYQGYGYYPLEFRKVGDSGDKYQYIACHTALERAQDIAKYHTESGDSFLVNNERCAKIVFFYEDGSTEEWNVTAPLPAVIPIDRQAKQAFDYRFIDVDGKEMRMF